MILYGFWRSTATWRVRIALGEKGLAYEYRPVHLRRDGGEQFRPGFEALNPMRQVPVLELDDEGTMVHLGQSVAIFEYLEERWPEPSLLPRGRVARARARQIIETIVSGIQPLQNTAVQLHVASLGLDERAWSTHWVTRGLAAVEALVSTTAGRFAVGDAVSFADACIVPQLYFARRFGVDLDSYPTLTRIEKACEARPAFLAAHANAQPDAEP